MNKLNLNKEIFTKIERHGFCKLNQNTFYYLHNDIYCWVFNIQADKRERGNFTFNFSITSLMVPQFKEKPGISLKPGARLNYFQVAKKHWWQFSEINQINNDMAFDEIIILFDNHLIPWFSTNSNVNSLIDIALNKPSLYSPSIDWRYIELFHYYLYSKNFVDAENVLFGLNNMYNELLNFMKDWLNNLKKIDYYSETYLLSIINENRAGFNLAKLKQLSR